MQHVACNLCGSDNAGLWGRKDGTRLVKCKSCGLVYCNPRPDNEELKRFYNRDYFDQGHYEEDSLRQRMYEIEIREIEKEIASSGTFLDVGCAVGKFLSTLPDRYEKWGTEFSEEAAGIGRKKFGLNIKTGEIRNISLPEDYFDIIQMRGVLEHSQCPLEDLTKIRKLLKTNGTLRISQLPNIRSICAVLFKTRFNQVKPGEHLYYFSPSSINAMLNKAGFRVQRLSYPYLNTPYASLISDTMNVMTYFLNKKDSPAFFGNMMIVYARKI